MRTTGNEEIRVFPSDRKTRIFCVIIIKPGLIEAFKQAKQHGKAYTFRANTLDRRRRKNRPWRAGLTSQLLEPGPSTPSAEGTACSSATGSKR